MADLQIELHEYHTVPMGHYKARIKQIVPKHYDQFDRDCLEIDYEIIDYRFPQEPEVIPVLKQICSRKLHPKSKLFQTVCGILGKAPTKADFPNNKIDLNALVGRQCIIEVTHKIMPSGDTFAIVQNVLPTKSDPI